MIGATVAPSVNRNVVQKAARTVAGRNSLTMAQSAFATGTMRRTSTAEQGLGGGGGGGCSGKGQYVGKSTLERQMECSTFRWNQRLLRSSGGMPFCCKACTPWGSVANSSDLNKVFS